MLSKIPIDLIIQSDFSSDHVTSSAVLPIETTTHISSSSSSSSTVMEFKSNTIIYERSNEKNLESTLEELSNQSSSININTNHDHKDDEVVYLVTTLQEDFIIHSRETIGKRLFGQGGSDILFKIRNRSNILVLIWILSLILSFLSLVEVLPKRNCWFILGTLPSLFIGNFFPLNFTIVTKILLLFDTYYTLGNLIGAFGGIAYLYADERVVFAVVWFLNIAAGLFNDALPEKIRIAAGKSVTLFACTYLLAIIFCLAFNFFHLESKKIEFDYSVGVLKLSVIGMTVSFLINSLIYLAKIVYTAFAHPNAYTILCFKQIVTKIDRNDARIVEALAVIKEEIHEQTIEKLKRGNNNNQYNKIKGGASSIECSHNSLLVENFMNNYYNFILNLFNQIKKLAKVKYYI